MYYKGDHQKELTKITNLESFTALALSDLHIGAIRAILHNTARDEYGNLVPQTIEQKILYENLINALKREKPIDVMITIGDIIDGRNRKAGGIGLINTDLMITVQWAVEILSEIIDILKPQIVLGVSGSEYHIADTGSDMDEDIFKRLADRYKNITFFFDQKIYAQMGKKIWYLTHSIGGDWANPPFPALTKVFTDLQKSSFKSNIPLPTLIGAGHTHNAQPPVQIYPSDNNPCYGFVSPCQKIGDRYTGSGSRLRYPDIGYMIIEQDGVDVSGRFVRTFKQCSTVRDLSKKTGLYVQPN